MIGKRLLECRALLSSRLIGREGREPCNDVCVAKVPKNRDHHDVGSAEVIAFQIALSLAIFGLLAELDRDNAIRPPPVNLIHEPSRGAVHSDVWAGATDPTGDLDKRLAGAGSLDRVETVAFRSSLQLTLGAEQELTEDITASAE